MAGSRRRPPTRLCLLCLLALVSLCLRLRTRASLAELSRAQELTASLESEVERKAREVEAREAEVAVAGEGVRVAESTLRQLEGRLDRARSLACEKEKKAFLEKASAKLHELKIARLNWVERETAAANESLEEEALSLSRQNAELRDEIAALHREKDQLAASIAEAEGNLAVRLLPLVFSNSPPTRPLRG